ncbi:SUMF1/EgtB/PvdO family nonheme iron enzyme [Thiohalocapsa sp.]|uniref:formylglycine-generating enzyme family protein n=1 Tax=Thiohalocapsa sp. TaxID=2497641 RepID=UPI0025E16497|nr:SUMF1/EgtB/PvdO family nonheme iron enzyme [Thiohalocapsa sp.]
MLGNVWEWTGSAYDAGYGSGESRLLSKKDANSVVLRGGSCATNPRNLRAAFRGRYQPDDRDGNVGFRLARTFSP